MEDKKTILIVEDETPLQSAIQAKLQSSGFETVTARSVEQALAYIEELDHIDAIWLDHYLIGRKDGVELVATLKKQGNNLAKIPVFLVTNTAGPDKIQTYMRLGIHKYYIKSDHSLSEIVADVEESLKNPE